MKLIEGDLSMSIRLPKLISHHMLLQRDSYPLIWGHSSSETELLIQLIDENKQEVVFHDHLFPNADDYFEFSLPSFPAGGLFTLSFIAGDEEVRITDITFGDIYVGSGQSNMELQITRVRDYYKKDLRTVNEPTIRIFTAPIRAEFEGEMDDYDSGEWLLATQEQLDHFSAVAFFFSQELSTTYQIPIGFLLIAQGGSPIEAWLDEDTLQQIPNTNYKSTIQDFKDPSYAMNCIEKANTENQAWYETISSLDEGLKNTPWYSDSIDFHDWDTISLPCSLEEANIHDFTGMIWFKKSFVLTKDMLLSPLYLWLGKLVDADKTYINGHLVGQTDYLYPPRKYSILLDFVREGENTITISLRVHGGQGRFVKNKPFEIFNLSEDGLLPIHTISLRGLWHYKIGCHMPMKPNEFFLNWQPTALYNGMLSPAFNYTIRGFLWYQGESNLHNPSLYDTLLIALIRKWRSKWGLGDLPFFIVQLPKYQPSTDTPSTYDSWASVRLSQAKALSEPNTAISINYDLGEWNDIHPQDKRELAHRIVLLAKNLIYHEKDAYASSPMLISSTYTHTDDAYTVSLTFDQPIQTRMNMPPSHLSYGNDHAGFAWVLDAKIETNTLFLSIPPYEGSLIIRYAYEQNPSTANLIGITNLPVAPFEISIN